MEAASKAYSKKDEIRGWLEAALANELSLPLEEVRRINRFDELGVDSILAVFLASELESKLKRPVDPNIMYECLDIDSLATTLSQ